MKPASIEAYRTVVANILEVMQSHDFFVLTRDDLFYIIERCDEKMKR